MILTLLTLLGVGISIGYLLTPKKDVAYEQHLEAQISHEKHLAEEALKKAKNYQKREELWMQIEKKYIDSLKTSRKETSSWRNKYANINHIAAPKYSEPELDSLISSIIR